LDQERLETVVVFDLSRGGAARIDGKGREQRRKWCDGGSAGEIDGRRFRDHDEGGCAAVASAGLI
jgi:hypothetical protein